MEKAFHATLVLVAQEENPLTRIFLELFHNGRCQKLLSVSNENVNHFATNFYITTEYGTTRNPEAESASKMPTTWLWQSQRRKGLIAKRSGFTVSLAHKWGRAGQTWEATPILKIFFCETDFKASVSDQKDPFLASRNQIWSNKVFFFFFAFLIFPVHSASLILVSFNSNDRMWLSLPWDGSENVLDSASLFETWTKRGIEASSVSAAGLESSGAAESSRERYCQRWWQMCFDQEGVYIALCKSEEGDETFLKRLHAHE